MASRTFTKEQIENIYFGDSDDNFELIEEEDWLDNGKCDLSSVIFKALDDQKIYRLNKSRQGSYHSDYQYDIAYSNKFNCNEVKKVEVIHLEWKDI